MLKRVLLLSASAGAGHVRAAEAIEKAFQATAADIEVRHVDVLNYTNKVFRHLYSKAYIDLVNGHRARAPNRESIRDPPALKCWGYSQPSRCGQ